jgi:hypothetical protein
MWAPLVRAPPDAGRLRAADPGAGTKEVYAVSTVTPETKGTSVVVEDRSTEDPGREAAIASLKRKRKFAEDLFAYLAVNGVLWLIWLLTDRSLGGGLPWPAWVSVIWGFLLAIDAWRAYGSGPVGRDRPITEDEIEREVRRTSRR